MLKQLALALGTDENAKRLTVVPHWHRGKQYWTVLQEGSWKDTEEVQFFLMHPKGEPTQVVARVLGPPSQGARYKKSSRKTFNLVDFDVVEAVKYSMGRLGSASAEDVIGSYRRLPI